MCEFEEESLHKLLEAIESKLGPFSIDPMKHAENVMNQSSKIAKEIRRRLVKMDIKLEHYELKVVRWKDDGCSGGLIPAKKGEKINWIHVTETKSPMHIQKLHTHIFHDKITHYTRDPNSRELSIILNLQQEIKKVLNKK